MKKLNLFIDLFFDQKSIRHFALFVVLGLSFSISVILATIGIMDGFEKSLRQGLKKSSGDGTVVSRSGFFKLASENKEYFIKNRILYSEVIQTESFLIAHAENNEDESESRGVLVKGVDGQFSSVTGLIFHLVNNEIAVGKDIAELLHLKKGDEVVLAFAQSKEGPKGLPHLGRFVLKDIIRHGIYQKDSRLVYLNINELKKNLELDDKINSLTIKFPHSSNAEDLRLWDDLGRHMGSDYLVRPYWKDFSTLIEAVKVEKIMIGLILQLVVVISIFNILAFIIFINEKKSKELILFRALGISQKQMAELWWQFVFYCWLISCTLSILFVQFFGLILGRLSFFNLPANIYSMARLQLYISPTDYAFVFLLAFFWIYIITYFLLRKIKKKTLLEGLRQEFS